MPIVLGLLDGVFWRGQPVRGERPRALLAALAASGGRTVPGVRLIEAVWGEDPPADAGKALQVLVSRTRAACGPEAVVHEGGGYRLGIATDQVDALRLAALTGQARSRLAAGDPVTVRDVATAGLELARSLSDDRGDGPLAEVRRTAAGHAAELAGMLGRALSTCGEHDAALPRLAESFERDPTDEAVLSGLLRSEAAVRGVGAALERYQRYRAQLRDRLGVDPGDELQRVHRDLVALDRPVRRGLYYDATPLIGREEDIYRLRGLLGASRVVSIVGHGGLGKTRLAHVLGRSATQPVVHFVELVGVSAPDDLIGEIGSALGVRDSVSGRRTLTPQQRADVRGRIAQRLGAAPTLLILDNCEHLVDPVAELVAFLVATTRELHVLTTSRAPLAISAERVYPLGELAGAQSAELFRQRAVAARPGVRLPDEAVRDIALRLEGLPLAIELAAAKVRAMSVEDVRQRLADRFALLRGGVRNVPDRHRTLTDVIEWSWNLLSDAQRRALRRLSVFRDGFMLAAAEAVVGPDALSAVQALVDQSLLNVAEPDGGVRYRMLETVREFGMLRLADAGEENEAYAARRDWATRYSLTAADRIFGPDQFAAIDALDAEETNLAEALRHALGAGDAEAVVQLLCGLGALWSLRGEHMRIVTLVDSVSEVLSGWQPPPELANPTRLAMAAVLQNSMIDATAMTGSVRTLLARLGPGDDGAPQVRAMVEVMLEYDPEHPERFGARLDELCEHPDRCVATAALHWKSHTLENEGDPASAIDVVERALTLIREELDGPWTAAIRRALLSQLHLQLGERDAAVAHAQLAIPVLQRLGALDDLLQLQATVALAAVADGRLDEAGEQIRRMGDIGRPEVVLGGGSAVRAVTAELALARGDHATGLAEYRAAVTAARAVMLPDRLTSGLEPWVLYSEACALAAFARYGSGHADDADGTALYDRCRSSRLLFVLNHPYLDFPVCGTVLFALGAWGLLRSALPPAEAVRLLVLAERFTYNRTLPTLDWAVIEADAERRAPGRIAALRAEYGDRRGPDLLDEARAVADRTGAGTVSQVPLVRLHGQRREHRDHHHAGE